MVLWSPSPDGLITVTVWPSCLSWVHTGHFCGCWLLLWWRRCHWTLLASWGGHTAIHSGVDDFGSSVPPVLLVAGERLSWLSLMYVGHFCGCWLLLSLCWCRQTSLVSQGGRTVAQVLASTSWACVMVAWMTLGLCGSSVHNFGVIYACWVAHDSGTAILALVAARGSFSWSLIADVVKCSS